MSYQYKDIKVFSSTEWLANNNKFYRNVFDESELSYIYCELSFYNKKFQQEDWNIKIKLRCIGPDGAEICNLVCEKNIKREDSVFYVREGWGIKAKGTYWKKGRHKWEATIEGTEEVFEKYFYIESHGLPTTYPNNYLSIDSIRLYEGPEENTSEELRNYLKVFDKNETRYVWVEFEASNLLLDMETWHCDLTFNFRSHNRLLKGSIDKLITVSKEELYISTTVGWGSDANGTWLGEDYEIDILFMNQLLATIPLKFADEEIEADEDEQHYKIYDKVTANEASKHNIEPTEKFDVLISELDQMIGLEPVKKKIRDYTDYLNFLKLRRIKGFAEDDKINLHAVFTGNPGTGKTTVAKMLGKLYKSLGLLSKGHVHEVDRSELVAEFIGQTAPKTKEAIKKAKGGVLFIDEAYSLSRKDDDAKDFGKEVIEVLIKEISDGDGDIAIVVAGYPEQMNNFLTSNPGLKSRFNLYFDFPDYQPKELEQIAKYAAKKRMINFSPDAEEFLYKKLVEQYRKRNENFGNARYVNTLLDDAKMNLGLRLMKLPNPEELTAEELSTVMKIDLMKIFADKPASLADIPIDDELLQDSLKELKSLIGLSEIKKEIDELVKLVRYYRETGRDIRNSFSLHTAFTGNPGTGKTTVARILASIYRALGILERGHLVECDRQALVGSHVGETAQKTKALIDKAMGGVLFIDEAYSLMGSENDFGREAVETLLKRMEDDRSDFIVIVAGYTEPMSRFLDSNPGLKSRFDRIMKFVDYSEDELMEIATKLLADAHMQTDKAFRDSLKKYIHNISTDRDKHFGNARSIRKLIEGAIKQQNLRLAEITAAKRNEINTLAISAQDLENVTQEDNNNKVIGFQLGS
ncbi:MAG: AAA family ATPase [Bacteroidetes bacterium]|nr:AAA family ATPase [Bacteroidota bacterium]